MYDTIAKVKKHASRFLSRCQFTHWWLEKMKLAEDKITNGGIL